MMILPMIHCAHPIHPKSESFSFKNIDDRIAQMTTDSAPIGVYLESLGDQVQEMGDQTYDDDGFHKGIRSEVAQFSNDHHRHARPP